jgi:hypothetical protein
VKNPHDRFQVSAVLAVEPQRVDGLHVEFSHSRLADASLLLVA